MWSALGRSLVRVRAIRPIFRVLPYGRLLGLALAIAGFTGCDSTGPMVVCSDEPVSVTVSAGTTPTFAWAPACGMASLQVRPVSGAPGSGWTLYTGELAPKNPLRSGIRYGSRPPVALEPAPATRLVAGTSYSVTVSRWVGDETDRGSLIPAGSTTFQP